MSKIHTQAKPSGPARSGRAALVGGAVVLWGVGCAAALFGLMIYSQTPGSVEEPPPAHEAGVEVADEGFTLVMAVHPRCPCTRASLFELERLMVRCGPDLSCRVLIYRPRDARKRWERTDLWASASRLPRTEVIIDEDGALAARLGCGTSGSVVLYDDAGAALFWGGITAARGHAGDNLGSDSIAAIVASREPVRRATLVYGCDLRTPGACVSTPDGAMCSAEGPP